MMDLAALQSLVAVEATGSVAAAATELGFTPSAVSQQIKRLERDLAVPLLERAGRGVVLTRQGRALVEDGRQVLAAVEEAAARARRHDDAVTGAVRLVAFSTAVRGLVAPVLAAVGRSAPGVTLSLTEQDPADAVATVAGGRADLGVVHNWVGVPLHLPPHLEVEVLGGDVADVLVHRSHPLAGRDRVTPGELLDETWVSTGVGTICHAWFLHMYAGFPRPPRVAYWAGEFASHLRLVEEAGAVALVPRLGRGPLPAAVVALPVTDPVPARHVQAVWRRSQGASPALQHVLAALRDRLAGVAAVAEVADGGPSALVSGR